jgi:hypothetical protein
MTLWIKPYADPQAPAGGVGKSALTGTTSTSLIDQQLLSVASNIVRFIKDVFVEHYDPTIEGEFCAHFLVCYEF